MRLLLLLLASVCLSGAADFQHRDVYLREEGERLVFGNARLELTFGKQMGEWRSLRSGALPVFDVPNATPAVDFRIDGAWMVERHGARLRKHTVAEDSGSVKLTLVLATGPVAEEWSLLSDHWRKRTRTGNSNAAPPPSEFELAITYRLFPGESRIERTAALTRLAGQNLLRSDSRRLEGLLFTLPDAAAGAPEECTLDIPGPFFPASYVPPGAPYSTLLHRYQSFHSAPEAGFGIFVVSNPKQRRSAGTWMDTAGEVAYLSSTSGDAHRITFLHHDLRCQRLFRRSRVESGIHHVVIAEGGIDAQLSAFRSTAGKRMPLDAATPAWVRDMVVLEAMPSFYDGGIKGLTKRLPFYREVGFNTLYLMPHYPGGYSPIDPLGVDPAIGTPEDLKAMVRAAHALGMRVLFDMVIHGFHAKSPLVLARPDMFVRDELGFIVPHATWGSLSTDWASPAYREYMKEYVLHDIDTYGIDGYRVDAATYKSPNWDPRIPYEAYRSSAAHGLLKEMMAAMRSRKPDSILLSEVFGPLYYSVSNSVHDNQTEAVPFLLERMERGESTAADYKQHLANVYAALPPGANRVLYARNHDTSWFYRFGGYTPRFLAAEAIHALFGIPEAFGGDPENGPHPDSPGVWDTYRRLFSFRREWPEFTSGEILLREVDGGNPHVFTGIRRGADRASLAIISLSDGPETVNLSGQTSWPGEYLDLHSGQRIRPSSPAAVTLKPFQVLVGRMPAVERQ